MTYVSNSQKAKNNEIKNEANYKHYNQLAKAGYQPEDKKPYTTRGSMNGNG